MQVTHTKPIAMYIRVSSNKQEQEGTSLQTQEDGCRAWAMNNGFPVNEEYIVREVASSMKLVGREGLSKVRQWAQDGEVSGVLAYSLDRLTRKQAHTAILAYELDEHKVPLLFATEDFEKSAVGELIRSAKAFAAELEREKILERHARGRTARVKQEGRPLNGRRAIYGYSWVDGQESNGHSVKKVRLEANPDTAPIIQRIYRDIVSGLSANKVAQALNKDGVPTSTGNPDSRWLPATITQMIRNPAYKGEYHAYRYNKIEDEAELAKHKTKTPAYGRNANGLLLPDVAEALVSPDVWERAIDNVKNGRKNSTRSEDNDTVVLRGGLLYCAYCGLAGRVRRNYSKPHLGYQYCCADSNRARYGCPSSSMSTHVLDAMVWDRLMTWVSNPVIIENKQNHQESDPTDRDRTNLERQIAALSASMQKLGRRIALIEDDDVAAAVLKDLNEQGRRKKVLEAEHQLLNDQHSEWIKNNDQLKGILEWAKKWERTLNNTQAFSVEDKRRVLKTLGVKVHLYALKDESRQGLPRFTLEVGGTTVDATDNRSMHSWRILL